MITVLMNNFKHITAEIYEKIVNLLILEHLTCSCGHGGCLELHGHYTRRLKTSNGTMRLRIQRVRCRNCKRTHAILPECIVPYSQIPVDTQRDMVQYSLGSQKLEQIMTDNPDITESDICHVKARFRKYWKERLLSAGINLLSEIRELVSSSFQRLHRQFLQIRSGINLENLCSNME